MAWAPKSGFSSTSFQTYSRAQLNFQIRLDSILKPQQNENYRTWILCLGVHAAAPYYSSQFKWSLTKAGNLAAIFGLMNIISRPLGGVLSDVLAKYFGMRGRLWALFSTLAIGGLGTALMGTQQNSSNVTMGMMVLSGWFLEVSPHGIRIAISHRSLVLSWPTGPALCICPSQPSPTCALKGQLTDPNTTARGFLPLRHVLSDHHALQVVLTVSAGGCFRLAVASSKSCRDSGACLGLWNAPQHADGRV